MLREDAVSGTVEKAVSVKVCVERPASVIIEVNQAERDVSIGGCDDGRPWRGFQQRANPGSSDEEA